jgi:hypothetical protein
MPLLATRRSTLRRDGRVIAEADIERLATELLMAACAADVIGMRAVFVAIDEMGDVDRSMVLGHFDGFGVRAVIELARIWGLTPAQALTVLTRGR